MWRLFLRDSLHARRYFTNTAKIFGVTPFLGDAANGPDLSDLFVDAAIPNYSET
jgi:hypothetical protein